MSRIQQDQFIDEDDEEEVCPLCVEEFDLGDRYFKPCPCGYQICQFCYNNIKTTMNGLCPACRRPYDDKPFSFKNITPEELLQHEKNKAAQQKKKAAVKQKEAQKREADNLSRKHLAGLRVRQRNLVYVTGLRPKIQGDRVAELLRGKEYFGQYGDIIKVVVSKSKDPTVTPNQPVGIYVTFARKEDAASCIEAINAAAQSGDGKIRAQHGTTKYCSAYLRGETCNNRNCMFLHEPGESTESFTRQDLSNMNASSTQQPTTAEEALPPQPPPQHTQPVAAAAQDHSPSSPISADATALPAGATWARRGSRATSSSVASPVVTNTLPAKPNDHKTSGDSSTTKSAKDTSSESASSRPASAASVSKPKKTREQLAFQNLLKVAFDPNVSFTFSTTGLSEEDIKLLNTLPPLWDPQGGAKRRLMKEREAEELRKQEEAAATLQETTKAEPVEPETAQGGSLQLGGEPEERPDRAFNQHATIQPPTGYLDQQHPFSGDIAGLSIRQATPSQQHQNQLLLRQLQSAGTAQHQIGVHNRQPSRFTFNETGGLKSGGAQQQAKGLGGFTAPAQQAPFYSGVQGPPPGLKTTGTPPVNGGNMFSHGQNFTSGYGAASAANRDAYDIRSGQQRGAEAKHELPALGQAIDPPRRATPTLPPGLFPNIEQQTRPVPEPESKPANEIEGNEDKIIPEPASEAQQEKRDKGKTPLVQPATPIKPAAKDPTPAESAASKKEAKPNPIRPATPRAIPETPVKKESSISHSKEDAISAIPKASATTSVQDTKAVVAQKAETPASKRPHPGKLNLDATPTSIIERDNSSPVPSASSKPDLVGRLSRAPSVSATSLSSRPGTPLASAVATGSPLKRTVQPRTLRITDTPRAETPPALPSATVAAAASTPPPGLPPQTVPSKVMSRRTSIASLNQPGTPLTERTDTISVTSTSASRANSPPPILTKAKSKKKEKAKKEKAAQVEAIIAPKEGSVEHVAPIMARKTKSKKSKPAREGPTPVMKTTPPPAIPEAKVEPPVIEPAPVTKVATEVVVPEHAGKGKAKGTTTIPTPTTPPPRDESNVQDKKMPDSPSPLTAAAILQALESTHQLALSTLNLLKPLASQSELKKLGIDPFTSADLQNHIEQLRFELTKADEQLLKQGQAVRKDLSEHVAKNSRVSGRCFVTPAGTRLSCLTKDEEDKYLEIEKRVMAEKGISRWGGAGMSHITKQALKPKKGKLQNTLAQEDILRALSIATESLEGALRDATKGSNVNVKAEQHVGPASVHLAGQTVAPPTRADGHPQDPTMDAREYVNKFVPRLLDANPNSVAVPPTEEEMVEDQYAPGTPGWNNRRLPVQHSGQTLEVTPQLLADATAAAGLAPRPELNLPPPSPHIPVPSSSSVTDANTAAAMDTLKEAMATAGAIAKLGANEALKSPEEILKGWDKAMAGTPAYTAKNLQNVLEKAVRRDAGTIKGGAANAPMSMADLEREGLKERVAEAKRDAADWEKRLNKVVRGNRKMALGGH